MPFSHLLVRALDQQWTGTLFIEPPHDEPSLIQFRRGLAVRMSVPDNYAPLGQLLVDSGAVMLAEVELTLGDDGMLGDVLIERGHADQQTIRRHVAWQLLVRLVRVFGMPLATKFAFYAGYDGLAGQRGEPVKVDPLRVLWAGLSAHGESTVHMAAVLKPLAERKFAMRPEAKLGRFGFPEAAQELLEFVRTRQTSLDEILEARLAPEQLARRIVYLLRICRYVSLVRLAKPATADRARSVPSSKKPVARITLRRVTMPRGVMEELAAEQAKLAAKPRFEAADVQADVQQPVAKEAARPPALPAQAAPRAPKQQLDPYDAETPIAPAVAASPAKPAEQTAAASAAVATEAAVAPERDVAKAARTEVPRPAKPAEATKIPRPATPPTGVGPADGTAAADAARPEPAGGPARAAASAPTVGPEADQQRQRLVELLERRTQMAPWELLELPRQTLEDEDEDAIDELLWEAYERFSKQWHPQFCPPELAAEKERFDQLHQAGADAYVSLLDPDQRAAYLAAADDGQQTADENQ